MKKSEVDSYIKSAPAWARPILKEVRRAIRDAAPEATESISYKMPYYSQSGRLAYFGAYKNHCSFFWISSADKKNFSKELAKQKVVGHTLQIPRGQKVPVAFIKKVVRSRVKSNQAKTTISKKSNG